ncbi:Cytokine-dependent hematopoietic cell linker [Fukomys damarensis]|uniref:Cytokine-dependent hematopoietic cell linker n=1 Tax=Fukomys damarensis TaxID=885580 RepID=A0A091D6B2_FUKDA|nr:Cytokine-dependent hematopoietic cell linker [Fukomys damarensis]
MELTENIKVTLMRRKRSWPPVSSATGQYQYRTVEETIPRCDRKTTTVLDTATFPSDDDYEDPELQLGDVWPSVKILPARPIKESEYADTRCFKGAADAPSLQHAKPSAPPAGRSQNTRLLQLEEVSALSAGHAQGQLVQKGSVQSCSPSRCQPPASCGPTESILPSANTGWRKPFPPRSAVKGVQHNEWYIGEHSRQVVEEALLQESKDGTFLVRDCSTKSTAEPYVLVVFHGNKVYNVKIRFLEGNRKFALGTGLRGDEKFDSVEDIIEHYKYFPITLIDGKDKSGIRREQCYLTQPLPLARRFSPW